MAIERRADDTRMHTAEFAALTTDDLDYEEDVIVADSPLPLLLVLLLVAAGGALGAILRLQVAVLMPVVVSSQIIGFPWPTLAVNMVGCVVIGFVAVALELRPSSPGWIRPFLVTGFCGGFTTVSTVGFEFAEMVGGGFPSLALGYASLTMIVSLGGCAFGISAAESLFLNGEKQDVNARNNKQEKNRKGGGK
ncbi:CrcB family protein [Dermabacteraceae bacterium TAE3-ERU27]|nr:CrcB family protein [Dermabacteraceae bacterium TAE3-ERU27]